MGIGLETIFDIVNKERYVMIGGNGAVVVRLKNDSPEAKLLKAIFEGDSECEDACNCRVCKGEEYQSVERLELLPLGELGTLADNVENDIEIIKGMGLSEELTALAMSELLERRGKILEAIQVKIIGRVNK